MTSEPVFATWDDVAAWLRALRSRAGAPAYAELARRVEHVRVERGERSRPARSTVFDSFQAGRRRMDLVLLTDLARALGVVGDQLAAFGRACAAVQDRTEAARVVTVTDVAPANPRFVGREVELARLTAEPGGWLVSGMPGVGKTQLALRAARSWTARGTHDRVLVGHLRGFHPTRPPAEGTAMLDELLRVLTGSPASRLQSTTERRRLLARLLAEKRCVLVLDDAATLDQVADIVDSTPQIPLLVTSRRRLDLPWCPTLALEPLPEQDAVELLRAVAGADTVGSDPGAARAIAASLGGLPLALTLTGRRIATTPGWTLRDHSDALARRVEMRRLPEPLAQSVELSYARLDTGAARVLRLLADQPCRALALDAVTALTGLDQPDADRMTRQLAEAHLVTGDDERVGLHDVVRAHAAGHLEDADAPSARAAARGRLLDHYSTTLRAAITASGLTPPVSREWFEPLDSELSKEQALDWLGVERESLLALCEPASAAVRPDFLLRVSAAFARLVDVWALFADGLTLSRRLSLQARTEGHPAVEALAELLTASNLVRLGESHQADRHLDRAAALVDQKHDPDTWVAILNTRAIRAHYAGDPRSALDLMLQALEVVERGGTRRTPPMLLGNIGAIHHQLGDRAASASFHERAWREAEAEGDLHTAAVALSNLGEVYLALGDGEAALAAALRGQDIAERLESRLTLATAATNLGIVLATLGRHGEARRAHHHALDLTGESGERHQHVSVLNDLGDTERSAGDAAAARDAYERAATLAAEIDNTSQAARAAEGLAALSR